MGRPSLGLVAVTAATILVTGGCNWLLAFSDGDGIACSADVTRACPDGLTCSARGRCEPPDAAAASDLGPGLDHAVTDALARDAWSHDTRSADQGAPDSAVVDAGPDLDAAHADTAAPDTALPTDAAQPDMWYPTDSSQPDTWVEPDASLADAWQPDQAPIVDAWIDDLARPDTDMPDSWQPDSWQPDTAMQFDAMFARPDAGATSACTGTSWHMATMTYTHCIDGRDDCDEVGPDCGGSCAPCSQRWSLRDIDYAQNPSGPWAMGARQPTPGSTFIAASTSFTDNLTHTGWKVTTAPATNVRIGHAIDDGGACGAGNAGQPFLMPYAAGFGAAFRFTAPWAGRCWLDLAVLPGVRANRVVGLFDEQLVYGPVTATVTHTYSHGALFEPGSTFDLVAYGDSDGLTDKCTPVDLDVSCAYRWHAPQDLDLERNPQVGWSLGALSDGGSLFTVLTGHGHAGNNNPSWYDDQDAAFMPTVMLNATSSEIGGIGAGQLGLYPGTSREAVLRWTAPLNLSCVVTATFFPGDTAAVIARVYVDGQTVWPAMTVVDSAVQVELARHLAMGETIDFTVANTDGVGAHDATPVEALIDCTPR